MLALFVVLCFASLRRLPRGEIHLVANWSYPDYAFRSELEHTLSLRKLYQTTFLAGVKASSDGTLYLSTPRWSSPKTPSALSRLIFANGEPRLDPYPSWEMNNQTIPILSDDDSHIHSVLGFEIDPFDRLWILDQGPWYAPHPMPSRPKLIIWDLVHNKSISTFVFGPEVASAENSFLNDIVVDATRNVAYISDSGLVSGDHDQLNGALIVFKLGTNGAASSARRVLARHFSTENNDTYTVEAADSRLPWMRTGADGIALSADRETLFWCPLSATSLYSIKTSLLSDMSTPEADLEAVTLVEQRSYASDGLTVANNGLLYLTSLRDSSVMVRYNDGHTMPLVPSDPQRFQWPDTLGFDHQGNLLVVANRLNQYLCLTNNKTEGCTQMDYTQRNFFVWSVGLGGADSYMHTASKITQWPLWAIICIAAVSGGVLLFLGLLLGYCCARCRSKGPRTEIMQEGLLKASSQ
ncbi:putative Major royal jelly protein [Paratrimastix pyriformis]|uniref:Major royal jelly protein n=1 Tax=Paratrimastix pyriformis TaxID=342808 RepID=A0ABQ8U2N3_9EUKA|nr:putative Major royal jelly protein [Paratrimastix pyriformis]